MQGCFLLLFPNRVGGALILPASFPIEKFYFDNGGAKMTSLSIFLNGIKPFVSPLFPARKSGWPDPSWRQVILSKVVHSL
jgi:hypothetical protein